MVEKTLNADLLNSPVSGVGEEFIGRGSGSMTGPNSSTSIAARQPNVSNDGTDRGSVIGRDDDGTLQGTSNNRGDRTSNDLDPIDPFKPTGGNEGETFDLESLNARIEQLYQLLLGQGNGNTQALGQGIMDFLKDYKKAFKNAGFDLNDKEAYNASMNLYNILSSYLSQQLDSAYERANWTYMTEYNSPLNCMKRALEAGINPAFYYGCLGNSNASEIGATEFKGAEGQGMPDTTPNWLRRAQQFAQYAQAANSAVSLFTGGIKDVGGFIESVANAAFARENTVDLQETRPSRIAANFGSYAAGSASAAHSTEQAITESENRPNVIANTKANAILTQMRAKDIKKQWKFKRKELQNAIDICESTNEANKWIGKYTADKNAAVNEYVAQLGAHVKLAELRSDALLTIAQRCYDVVETEDFYEEGSETGLSGSISAQSGKLWAAFLKAKAEGSSSFTFGGKTYTRKKVQKNVFNPVRYEAAIRIEEEAYRRLRAGEILDSEYYQIIHECESTIDEESKNMHEASSRSYAKKTMDYDESISKGNGTGSW